MIDRDDEVREMYDLDADPDLEFWRQRDTLTRIHGFARSRRVSPYATLAAVLRRATSAVPPHVRLPALVGGYGSLNLFTISVGRSGAGKGGSDAAAMDAVSFPDINGDERDAPRPNLGSGEGLARLFKGSAGQEPLTAVHLVVPEVSTLASLVGRQGSSLAGELLKAYSGEPLGFSNAHKETNTAIEGHSYRLCLGVGVQPENAEFFFTRAKDGFPQRFLWVPVADPYAPRERPEPVTPLQVTLPDFADGYVVGVPEGVVQEIDYQRWLVLTEDPDVDPLDAHLSLTRLKLAFSLALLEERRDIEDGDWKVAGDLIELSTRTRLAAQQVCEEQNRRSNRAKAHAQADREAIVEERLTERSQKRVKEAILRKLRAAGKTKRLDLRRVCNSRIRPDFDAVFEVLVDEGVIVCCEGVEGHAELFMLAE